VVYICTKAFAFFKNAPFGAFFVFVSFALKAKRPKSQRAKEPKSQRAKELKSLRANTQLKAGHCHFSLARKVTKRGTPATSAFGTLRAKRFS
jgi:hypothetical protein